MELLRMGELRCREVINICDGARLGFPGDMEFDRVTGQVTALIIPGPARFFGLFGHEDDVVIPWEHIRRVGDDIVLIESEIRPPTRPGFRCRFWCR
ncbi:MAG: YlmC/YmxH family sporulation protein [Oscillospiraceae bacterium]|jgi:YlmC/YmxH family sporulation protein|nr:YlmC/YmxH family sporulation protein [Oscillospiraceae bacterium]